MGEGQEAPKHQFLLVGASGQHQGGVGLPGPPASVVDPGAGPREVDLGTAIRGIRSVGPCGICKVDLFEHVFFFIDVVKLSCLAT